jgi:hypothetical protein
MTMRLAELLSRSLSPLERDAALGDLAESGATAGQGLRDICGLVVRRQAAYWRHPWPWIALVGVALPFGAFLNTVSRLTTYSNSITLWLYAGNWDWRLLGDAMYRHDLAGYGSETLLSFLTLGCYSWTTGFLLAVLSRNAIVVNRAAFCLLLLPGALWGIPLNRADPNSAVFELTFYRLILLPIIQTTLVLLPSLWGIRKGARLGAPPKVNPQRRLVEMAALLTAIAGIAAIVFRNGVGWWLLLHVGLYWPIAYSTAGTVRRRFQRSNP